MAGMIGGRSQQQPGDIVPGEITLAHSGVLFLDELTEFSPKILDSLRQPMETRSVLVSRSGATQLFPADFHLVAASNPCKCGHAGTPHCRCTPNEVRRYLARLSGPLLDRIDIAVRMFPTTSEDLQQAPIDQQSKHFLSKVVKARIVQLQRNGRRKLNSDLSLNELEKLTSPQSYQNLLQAKDTDATLSTRKIVRILRVARTIADIVGTHLSSENSIRLAKELVDFDLIGEYLP